MASLLERIMTQNSVPSSDANNNVMETSGKISVEKYSLRPRCSVAKRTENEEYIEVAWKSRGKRNKRTPKQKPAPLSKYRRKTANARERCRMREINDGFEALRRVLPQLPLSDESENLSTTAAGGGCEKLTKISTLRLAMKYITTLNRILQENPAQGFNSMADVESDGGESFFSESNGSGSDFGGSGSGFGGSSSSDRTTTTCSAALTPPGIAFSDASFCTDFSEQLLSPSDFAADSLLPGGAASSDLDLVGDCLPCLGDDDFNFCDFVNDPAPGNVPLESSLCAGSSSSCSSSSTTSNSSTPNSHFGNLSNLDECLPELNFDAISEYSPFDTLSYMTNISNFNDLI